MNFVIHTVSTHCKHSESADELNSRMKWTSFLFERLALRTSHYTFRLSEFRHRPQRISSIPMSSFSNAAYNYDTHLAVAQSPEHRQNDGSLTVNPLWHEREPSFIDSLHRYATSPHPPSDWSARTGVMDNERHRFFSASDHKEFVNGSPSMANIECNQVPLKRGPGISKLSQRIDNIYASWEKSGKITSLNHEEMAEIATALAIRQYGSKYAIEIGAGLEYIKRRSKLKLCFIKPDVHMFSPQMDIARIIKFTWQIRGSNKWVIW